jgi:prepilin-type processing-associated H-X9-DG protein
VGFRLAFIYVVPSVLGSDFCKVSQSRHIVPAVALPSSIYGDGCAVDVSTSRLHDCQPCVPEITEHIINSTSDFYIAPTSGHVSGVNMSFCDGAVVFMSENLSPEIFARLMTSGATHYHVPGHRIAGSFGKYEDELLADVARCKKSASGGERVSRAISEPMSLAEIFHALNCKAYCSPVALPTGTLNSSSCQ